MIHFVSLFDIIKLVSSVLIMFDDNLRVTSVTFFAVDFNLFRIECHDVTVTL